jgi:hypothetical protein
LAPKADIPRDLQHVGYVPIVDISEGGCCRLMRNVVSSRSVAFGQLEGGRIVTPAAAQTEQIMKLIIARVRRLTDDLACVGVQGSPETD